MRSRYLMLATAALSLLAIPVSARVVDVTLTVSNLALANSISFAPLRFGFNNGTFDAFNQGQAATAPIISVAEGGSGSAWLPAFAAADPTAVLGSTSGALLPGVTQTTATFRVDTAINPYFTFASMVVPSNDFFIGNDDPKEYRLFDAAGNLVISQILQTTNEIWDAGSEAFDPLNAAFLVIGNNDLRTPQNGVVGFNFTELSGFNGLQTAAGYTFASNLSADQQVYRIAISATAVPEPSTWAVLFTGLLGMVLLRRRAHEGADGHGH